MRIALGLTVILERFFNTLFLGDPSINVSNSHLLKDGNAMLYISLGIERWYQRYSDCYLRLATKKVTEIDDGLCVILPSICPIDFGIHVFDVHYPLVNKSF